MMPMSRRRIEDEIAEMQIEIARRRQELLMRWILFFTVVTSALLLSFSTLLYGPPALPSAMVQGSWVTLLAWMARRLFRT
jgi:hypothetical protein